MYIRILCTVASAGFQPNRSARGVTVAFPSNLKHPKPQTLPKMAPKHSKPARKSDSQPTEKGYVHYTVHRFGGRAPESRVIAVPHAPIHQQLSALPLFDERREQIIKKAFAPEVDKIHRDRQAQAPWECHGCGANDASLTVNFGCDGVWSSYPMVDPEDPNGKSFVYCMQRDIFPLCDFAKGGACYKVLRKTMRELFEEDSETWAIKAELRKELGTKGDVGRTSFVSHTCWGECGKRTYDLKHEFKRCSRCKIAIRMPKSGLEQAQEGLQGSDWRQRGRE